MQTIRVGSYTLDEVTSGYANIGIGYYAGSALTTGIRNTIIGENALDAALDVDNSVAIGYNAGGAHTTGDDNVWIGKEAGESATYHASCVAVGTGALGRSSGSFNTAIGREGKLSGNQGGGVTNSNRNADLVIVD